MRVERRANANEQPDSKASARAGASARRRQPSATATHFGTSRPDVLLTLQSSVGNHVVAQLLREAGHPWAQDLAHLQEEQHQHAAGCSQQPAVAPLQRSTVPEVLRSPGRPLEPAVRADLEPKMGADFADVRVHDDEAAQASAAEVGARAYTVGGHIVIGKDGADKRTMAHELTHVIQQRRGPVAGMDNGAGLRISDPCDRFEREAEANAARVMSSPAPQEGQALPAARETGPAEAIGETGPGQAKARPAEIIAASASAASSTAASAGPPGLTVQRTAEQDLATNPKEFLATRMLSMDLVQGMKARWDRPALSDVYHSLAAVLGSLDRHWFVLTPDPRRQRSGPAYLLTPAVEKYAADDACREALPFLRELAAHADLPPVLPDGSYLRSTYVPYLAGGAVNPEQTVGHKDILKEPGDAPGAGLVFTATMNGCAVAVTGSSHDGMFQAWHYQSPGKRMTDALRFQQDHRAMDWFGHDEYMGPGADKSAPEVTNMLSFGENGWEVLGQEVMVSTSDMNSARIGKTSARPLKLEPAGPEEIFRQAASVYTGIANEQLEKFNRAVETMRKCHPSQELLSLVTDVQKKIAINVGGILIAGNVDDLQRTATEAARQAKVTLLQVRTGIDKHVKEIESKKKQSKDDGFLIERLLNFAPMFEGYQAWLSQLQSAAERMTPSADQRGS